jgi:Ca-activated chloride channel family protein
VRTRACCAFLALLGAGLALLQPVAAGPDANAGADVVLCIDVSRSMACRDVSPSRLAVVVREVAACLANGGRSRFALVAFAGSAEVLVPLTADAQALGWIAADLAPGTVGVGGSDPAAAIDLAASMLLRSGGGAGGEIAVLGDGEDFVGRGPAAATAARARGLRVHTLAVGGEGGSKIPIDGERGEAFLRTADGSEIISRLELAALRELARAGGGECVLADDAGALSRLHEAVWLPAARAAALRSGALVPQHRFAVPLLLAIGLWMLRACLPERRRP